MARYLDVIDLPLPIEAAFDYLADFARSAEWDPGVVEAERLTPGAPRRGSRFRVVASFLGRRIPMEYEIAELERPSRLVLVGGDAALRSVDEISFAPRAGGTRVTYEARLELGGWRRLADPLLHLAFQRVGRAAARGLHEAAARAAGVSGSTRRGPQRTTSVRPAGRATS
jgi:carbon monoxide dehydrogenase subunit G